MTRDEARIVVEALAPVVRDFVTKAVHALELRVNAAELAIARVPLAEAALGDLEKTLGGVRERVAAVEARKPEPGPPGPPGAPGEAGKDGVAGLRYCGVFEDTKTYEPGDVVTWGGSSWHCDGPTTGKPLEGGRGWSLMVKRGRDGRDGKS